MEAKVLTNGSQANCSMKFVEIYFANVQAN